jgi:uncharacterized phage protein (TIGR01671 family)
MGEKMIHGVSKTRLYAIFSGMKQRCYNPNRKNYQYYGGKGVIVCDEWMTKNGIQNFIEWALSSGYNDSLSIDRIDSDEDYVPNNCRWVTISENAKNQPIGDRFISMKCTGMKDKNGMLIFEGDIIKTKMFGKDDGKGNNFADYDNFAIVFTDGSFMLNTKERSFSATYIPNKESKFEIIGNVHDNPELCTEKRTIINFA